MTIGEKIKKIRTFRVMTQKEFGLAIGLEEKGADNRIAQYETNYRIPKCHSLGGTMLETEYLLKRLSIAYTRLTDEQIIEHKQTWVHRFIPPDNQQKASECYCLPSDGELCDYLWHAFSFELLDGLCGDEAREALQSQQIGEVILLSNWDDSGFHIPNASALTAATLEEIADVVVTSADYKWTYAKTHEYDLGPYFYKKNYEKQKKS